MDTSQKFNLRTGLLVLLVLLAALSRLIPHMPNFSPLAAISLFGAAYFKKTWQAFLIPIAATWLSDLLINNVVYAAYFPSFTWLYPGFYWQYGSYLLIALSGLLMLKKVNITRVVGAGLMATAIFFLVTNFAVWLGSKTYSQNRAGLISCYVAGIPFIKGTLLGNLVYSGALFGTFAWMQQRYKLVSADR